MAYLNKEKSSNSKIYDSETILNNDDKKSKEKEIDKVNEIFNEMLNNLNNKDKNNEKRE